MQTTSMLRNDTPTYDIAQCYVTCDPIALPHCSTSSNRLHRHCCLLCIIVLDHVFHRCLPCRYCNQGMKTLPNGLGMGGQLDYFAIFLNKDLLTGHCKGEPSTTYRNPRYTWACVCSTCHPLCNANPRCHRCPRCLLHHCHCCLWFLLLIVILTCRLSNQEAFKITCLEAWLVGPPAEGGPAAGRSILVGRETDTAILEMAGKRMHSQNLREPHPEDRDDDDDDGGEAED